MPQPEIDARIAKAAAALEIEQFLDRKPRQLSGGQRQRVAMGRANVREPAAFLFDEPLSNLDAKLRVQMPLEIRRLQRSRATTGVYVTHDQMEAMTLADRPGGAQWRPDRAGRHSNRPLREASDNLRCDLHRLAVDEPPSNRERAGMET
jgi:ABC-type sugar transport system ATPase subunit